MRLFQIAQDLAQLYRFDESPIPEQFLLDPACFQAWCAAHPECNPRTDETLIVAAADDGVDVGLYIAPHVLEHLAAAPPHERLTGRNIQAACLAIEGVSHLLCVLWKLEHGQTCTQLELELQAEIDKYLLCAQWLRRQGASAKELLPLLFEHFTLAGGMDAAGAERYHAASALAERFCRALETTYQQPHRLPDLAVHMRAFYRLSHWQKLRHVSNPLA